MTGVENAGYQVAHMWDVANNAVVPLTTCGVPHPKHLGRQQGVGRIEDRINPWPCNKLHPHAAF